MPTVFTHPAVALAALPLLKGIKKKTAVVLTGAILTVLPDMDVIAFKFGIPYHHVLGHRGFSHSILFSLLLSTLVVLIFKQSKLIKSILVWLYLLMCSISHGLLDAITNGGLGVGFFIPFSEKRYFFEYRPIQVSTLSIDRFFNGQGSQVFQIELLYVWLPALLIFIVSFLIMFTKNKIHRTENSRQ